MDFSRLPDTAFLKISDYLSLEDRMRMGRVNKIFRRIAQLAISQTKSLDLTEDRFRNLNGDQLAVILDMCSSNLEQIKFPSQDAIKVPNTKPVDYWKIYQQRADILNNQGRQLATIFSNYRCPRLIDMVLGRVPIDNAVFDRLIRNIPNIECLIWSHDFAGFPDITYNSLKKVEVCVWDNVVLQSMIGRCPNLKELELSIGSACNDTNLLDEFFRSIPQVDQIYLWVLSSDAVMSDILFRSELVNFWNLHLTSLRIQFPGHSYYYSGDSILHKVATAFPHLKKLDLFELTPTNAGIATLAALQELEILNLCAAGPWDGNDHDHGIRQLAHCKKLQKFSMHRSNISAGTLLNLIRSCPQLEYVEIFGITQVDNPGEAAVVLESLAGIARRDITIKFHCFLKFVHIWKTEPVKYVIGKLEEIDGLKITLTVPENMIDCLDRWFLP